MCSYFVCKPFWTFSFYPQQGTLLSRDSLIVWSTESHTDWSRLYGNCISLKDDRNDFECELQKYAKYDWPRRNAERRNRKKAHFYYRDCYWGFCLWRHWMMKSPLFSFCHWLPQLYLSRTNTELMWAGCMTWTVPPSRTLFVSPRPFTLPAQWVHSFPFDEVSALKKHSCRKEGIWQHHYCKGHTVASAVWQHTHCAIH